MIENEKIIAALNTDEVSTLMSEFTELFLQVNYPEHIGEEEYQSMCMLSTVNEISEKTIPYGMSCTDFVSEWLKEMIVFLKQSGAPRKYPETSFVKFSIPNSDASCVVHDVYYGEKEVYLHVRNGSVIRVEPGEHDILIKKEAGAGAMTGLKVAFGGIFALAKEVKKQMNGDTGQWPINVNIPDNSLLTVNIIGGKWYIEKVVDYETVPIDDADIPDLIEASKKTK